MAVKKYFKIAFLLFLVLPLGGIILGKLTQKEQHSTPSTRTRPPAPVAIKTASAHPWEFFKRENEVALFDSEIILDNLLALLKTNDAFQIWSYTKKIQEGNFLGTTCDHEVCQQLRWGIRGLHDSMKNGKGMDFSALEGAKNNLGRI